jgi:1-acyl-sn-glycerol-3-phosphate acyltransferase
VKIVLFPVRLLYCLYALLVFVAVMLLILPFVAILSLQKQPGAGNRIYRVCRWWGSAWMTLIGIRHEIVYEARPASERQYIFISNHISYLDIPVIFQAITRDSIRILGKIEMARIPVFGYIYRKAVVMVDRSTAQERSRSVRELKGVLSMGVSIFIFPEGTFNETGFPLKDFYDGAFRIAIETQTPLQPILFLGTYELMHYSSILRLRPGRLTSVYLPVVEVQGMSLTELPLLKERVHRKMEEGLQKYGAPWASNLAKTRESS